MSEERYKKFVELFKHPLNRREMRDADVIEIGRNTCGDSLTVYLKIKDGRIEDISYQGAFCAFSNASASQVTETVKGMKLDEVLAIDEPRLFELIGEDLRDNPHRLSCILFPLTTIKRACEKYKSHTADNKPKPLDEEDCHCDSHNSELGI